MGITGRICQENPEKRSDALNRENRLRKQLLEELEFAGQQSDSEIAALIDEMVMQEHSHCNLSLREKDRLKKSLFASVRQLDVLEEMLRQKDITEIMITGYDKIFVERNGQIEQWSRGFASPERLDDIIQRIVGMCNRVVNEQNPIADARLPDGKSRVNVVLPPVAIDGPQITIRRFPERPITMQDMIRSGTITREAALFLQKLVGAGYSIMIGGGTSTGKTTFLNALSHAIPKSERVITIEDNAELQIQGIDNLVRLEAKSANLEGGKNVTIRDLIRTALRMRPDRIVIGEIRGAEALDFLTALNTGHDGSLGTAHANTTRDMVGRIETMVLMGSESLPIPVIRRQIAAGIRIMVHLSRDQMGKRQVEEIVEITGMKGDDVEIHTLFARDISGKLVMEGQLRNGEQLKKYEERTEKKERKGSTRDN